MAETNREIGRDRIGPACIELEMRLGHLRWSITMLAKSARVSRSLVYYYFGKTKSEILILALTELVEEFYGLSASRADLPLVDSLVLTHRMYKQNPKLAAYFHHWRQSQNELAKVFIEVEKKYEGKLRALFVKATPDQIRGLHSIFHGLVTAPYLERSSIEAALNLLKLETLR